MYCQSKHKYCRSKHCAADASTCTAETSTCTAEANRITVKNKLSDRCVPGLHGYTNCAMFSICISNSIFQTKHLQYVSHVPANSFGQLHWKFSSVWWRLFSGEKLYYTVNTVISLPRKYHFPNKVMFQIFNYFPYQLQCLVLTGSIRKPCWWPANKGRMGFLKFSYIVHKDIDVRCYLLFTLCCKYRKRQR